jgi:hypothetical protein
MNPTDEVLTATRHANAGLEQIKARGACQEDLFEKPTQKDIIYAFIKSRGRILSHELNEYACIVRINCPSSRARELKAEGKIWHIREDLMPAIYPHSKEIGWSTYEADR